MQISHALEVKVCNPDISLKDFLINDTAICKLQEFMVTSHCQIELFDPTPRSIVMEAFACTILTTGYNSFENLIGGVSVSPIKPFFQPMDQARCNIVHRDLIDPIAGALTKDDEYTFSTKNVLKLDYSYMQTLEKRLETVYLHKFVFLFDFVKKTLLSNFVDMKDCEFHTGVCKTDKYTISWDNKISDLCNHLLKSKIFEGKMIVHSNKEGAVIRADIQQMDLSFFHGIKVTGDLKKCFVKSKNDTVLATPEGYIIRTKNCKHMTSLEHYKSDVINRKLYTVNHKLGATLDYLYSKLVDLIKKGEERQHFLECKSDAMNTQNLKVAAKIDASAVLSQLLGKETNAILNGDVISQIPCKYYNGTLRKHLKINNDKFATRPIVDILINNKSIPYQLSMGKYFTKYINHYERYKSHTKYIFQLNDKLYTFLNYSMTDRKTNISIVYVKHGTMSLVYPQLDFSLAYLNNLNEPNTMDFVGLQNKIQGLIYEYQPQVLHTPFGDYENKGNFANWITNSIGGLLVHIRGSGLITFVCVLETITKITSTFVTIYIIFKICKKLFCRNNIIYYDVPSKRNTI